MKHLLILFMAMISIFSSEYKKPKGNIVSCSFTVSKQANRGTVSGRIYLNQDGKTIVTIHNTPAFYSSQKPVDTTTVVETSQLAALQKMVDEEKIFKVNGYHIRENYPGGTSYSLRIEYDSGEEVSMSFYTKKPKPEAMTAFEQIYSFFKPWRVAMD